MVPVKVAGPLFRAASVKLKGTFWATVFGTVRVFVLEKSAS
jgi:hypothetical protein